MKINKKLAAIGGAVALLAGGATVATAAIPDSTSGEVTACYTTTGGQVRLIDKENGASCHSYETEVAWPSEAPEFAPKVHITNYQGSSGGSATLQETECPAGEKLISGISVEKSRFARPHDDTNWHSDPDINGGTTSGPETYVVDGSNTVIGMGTTWSGTSDLMVVLTCSE